MDNAKCILIIVRDISELIQGEYLKSIEKISEIMIASTSHDMRTPLNTISTMCMMIKGKAIDNEVLNWINIANNSTHILKHLVNDTLDYA